MTPSQRCMYVWYASAELQKISLRDFVEPCGPSTVTSGDANAAFYLPGLAYL